MTPTVTMKITAILWSWSWEGYTVRYEDGRRENKSARQLVEEVGETEYERLNRIAHRFPCNCFKEV